MKTPQVETPATTGGDDENKVIDIQAAKQPLTANFDILGETTHTITEGAKLPDNVAGADAEAVRGRGRPKMSDMEREAARERKREADRKRRGGKPATKTASADPAGIDQSGMIALANAQLVCSMLDLLSNAISGGEYQASPEQRAATVGAWTAYLHAEGVTLPPWVQVSLISVMHVAPAFATETGKGKVSGIFAKLKAWWIVKRG